MSLVLTRSSVVATEPTPGMHSWPLQVTAVSTITGLPSEIFVYHASMGDDPIVGDIFECVASVEQLDELGTEAGITEDGSTIPFYRSATLLFNCRYPREAEDLWVKIQEDVVDLINNVRSSSNLVETETVTLT